MSLKIQKRAATTYHGLHTMQATRNPGVVSSHPLLYCPCAHTVAMIKYSLDVIKTAVEHLNTGQTPVVAFDQPLYALAKQIQWKLPEKYGEGKFVMMFGGLHIEMVALKTIGDWLWGNGWAQALVQAEIATAGTADSFYRASHVMRTRRAHQITAAALHILKHQVYDHCNTARAEDGQIPADFEVGRTRGKTISLNFTTGQQQWS